MTFKDLQFIINPDMRLSSPYLLIKCQEIEFELLTQEAQFPAPNRVTYIVKRQPSLICETIYNQLNIYYSAMTNFEQIGIQRWLRKQIKAFIELVARRELPKRLHFLEKEKNLYCKSVTVKKLRKNTLGTCSQFKQITLSPKLVLFPQRMCDAVILHEMAHLKYLHHKKSFWNYLSSLLGEDANIESLKSEIAYSKNHEMIDYLMK
ncbi:M48 family metallopeptidase [Parabacteroides sp. OttesenSCG-928-G06]|nr:M48 family metallopeptidase [Parabacteroides sp. OttesenSCG-928-G06]